MSRRTNTPGPLPPTLQAALRALPPTLQASVKRHPYDRERGCEDLISECWLALLKAKPDTPHAVIFKRGRSAVRRFGQDPAHYGAEYDARTHAGDALPTAGRHWRYRRAELVQRVTEERQCSSQYARRLIADALAGAQRGQGDLFAGGVA